MDKNASNSLAASMTRSASKQTYYTIRFFVDRGLVQDAYRAYAYFRWVDDCLDADQLSSAERAAFIARQQAILETCYQGQTPDDLSAEEMMLVELVHNNPERPSGLGAYLSNMMAVMDFDVRRRGRPISQAELSEYSRLLSIAVTEALHYFIGHDSPSPQGDTRYLAVRGAHIIHMLRDWQEDVTAGYFNIPDEYARRHGLVLGEMNTPAFREWVSARVHLARSCFQRGRATIARVKNLRCRLAGFAYLARFEWMLHAIERDGYHLRPAYPERKSWRAGVWMLSRTLSSAISPHPRALQPSSEPFKSLERTNYEI